jgi:hypothetical protein
LMGGAVGISDTDGGLQRLAAMPFRNGAYFWGDIDGNGYADFVVISETVLAGIGIGDGTFEGPIESSQNVLRLDRVRLVDIDGDGASDIIGLYQANAIDTAGGGSIETMVRLLLGDGAGYFGAPEDLSITEGAAYFDIADFDGDGLKDLILGRRDGALDLRLRAHDGWQTARIVATEDRRLYPNHYGDPLVIADINGDGIADIVSAIRFGQSPQQLVALVGAGDGSFVPRQLFPSALPEMSPYSLSAGDVNQDGKDDILAVDTQLDGQISLWLSH